METHDRVVSERIDKMPPVVGTTSREVVGILVVGAIVGAAVAAAYYLLGKYIFAAVLCREGADATCAQAPEYAMVVSMVIGAVIGLLGLVQGRVYRPLLAVTGVVVTLWGFMPLIIDMSWYWGSLTLVVTFALTYLLYAWVARIRSFILASVITIILFVIARLLAMS